jgi:hypothetical protein
MKKLVVLTLVIVLLSVTFVPALAAKGPSGNQLYAIAGYIRAIDATNKTITVEVMVGNRLGDDYLNQKVVIKTYAQATTIDGVTYQPTRILLSGGTVIAFSDLKVGDSVSSNGYLVDGIWHAARVTKGALLLIY